MRGYVLLLLSSAIACSGNVQATHSSAYLLARQQSTVQGDVCQGRSDCLATVNGGYCLQESLSWTCYDAQETRITPTQSACAASPTSDEYDMGLHIAAVFIVLIASALGVALPLLLHKYKNRPIVSLAFLVSRHFATGVILATAFVHLLYEAFSMFFNPCIGDLVFEPIGAVLALAGTMFTFIIDFFSGRILARQSKEATTKSTDLPTTTEDKDTPAPPESAGAKQHAHRIPGLVDYSSKQAHFDVILLDAGIVFHSIMIGVSLGATGGSSFITLLIAIVFHQLFEGMALGARIGLLEFARRPNLRKFWMAVPFALVTPVGISIGIGLRNLYSANSQASLWSQGVLDGFSSGILLYIGLIELLSHDFLHGEVMTASPTMTLTAFVSLFLGLLSMTVIGHWA